LRSTGAKPAPDRAAAAAAVVQAEHSIPIESVDQPAASSVCTYIVDRDCPSIVSPQLISSLDRHWLLFVN
jgi:alpha-D-ribose 1-methylphosphonate 5-triphosphate synthase subunit PhnH